MPGLMASLPAALPSSAPPPARPSDAAPPVAATLPSPLRNISCSLTQCGKTSHIVANVAKRAARTEPGLALLDMVRSRAPGTPNGANRKETSRKRARWALSSSNDRVLPAAVRSKRVRAGVGKAPGLRRAQGMTSPIAGTVHDEAPGSGTSFIHVAPTLKLSDTELVRRARAGDGWAEKAIYRRYAAQILGLSKRLLADRHEAEDVTQETFAVAFAEWDKLRDPERLRPWLMQIAVSKVLRRFRRRRMRSALGFRELEQDASLDALAHPACSQEVKAELALVAKALNRLSAGERIAWTLRHVEGMSLEEVASQSDCSLPTAKRRIARAADFIERFARRGGQ